MKMSLLLIKWSRVAPKVKVDFPCGNCSEPPLRQHLDSLFASEKYECKHLYCINSCNGCQLQSSVMARVSFV